MLYLIKFADHQFNDIASPLIYHLTLKIDVGYTVLSLTKKIKNCNVLFWNVKTKFRQRIYFLRTVDHKATQKYKIVTNRQNDVRQSILSGPFVQLLDEKQAWVEKACVHIVV